LEGIGHQLRVIPKAGVAVRMVFKTLALFVRNRGPDEFWRKRKILKLSAVRYYKLNLICK